jgi:hypothetical protein
MEYKTLLGTQLSISRLIFGCEPLGGADWGKIDENLLEQLPFANTGWCYSIESMLLSAIDGPDKVVSIAMQHEHIDRIKQLGSNLSNQDWIKWTEFILPDDSLPKNYFSFQPQPYIPLLGDSISATALKNITVKINNAPLQMFHNEAFIDVYFESNSSSISILCLS